MPPLQVVCSSCKKEFYRDADWVEKNKRLGYKNYCSLKCMSFSSNGWTSLICVAPECPKKFDRLISAKSPNNFCSRSCAATVNNSKFPKRKAMIKKCNLCGKEFTGDAIKYCSVECQYKGAIISEKGILKQIREFYEVNGRIPLKREFSHYHAARERFGTWNNAIKAAGFEPNQVMFAKKYIANDGHKCDSLAEKIIDDWLYARKIKHKTNVSYPGNNGLTADFVVGDYWTEFFGLSGEHRKYDQLKEQKLRLAKKHKLKLIEIYPTHLFPKNKLNKVLGALIN